MRNSIVEKMIVTAIFAVMVGLAGVHAILTMRGSSQILGLGMYGVWLVSSGLVAFLQLVVAYIEPSFSKATAFVAVFFGLTGWFVAVRLVSADIIIAGLLFGIQAVYMVVLILGTPIVLETRDGERITVV